MKKLRIFRHSRYVARKHKKRKMKMIGKRKQANQNRLAFRRRKNKVIKSRR